MRTFHNFSEQEFSSCRPPCVICPPLPSRTRAGWRRSRTHDTDDCTGLYTRGIFYKTLETEVTVIAVLGYEFSVLVIDLDRFKAVNDTPRAFDRRKLLAEIGIWVKALRLIDYAFRTAGMNS